mmetsp:Transcript_82741/g.198562  ORF Transcript_82741/g.198562 Transcript_82741/m.198562 type:complete len:372 (-) Transcript_82741:97-1212(-)
MPSPPSPMSSSSSSSSPATSASCSSSPWRILSLRRASAASASTPGVRRERNSWKTLLATEFADSMESVRIMSPSSPIARSTAPGRRSGALSPVDVSRRESSSRHLSTLLATEEESLRCSGRCITTVARASRRACSSAGVAKAPVSLRILAFFAGGAAAFAPMSSAASRGELAPSWWSPESFSSLRSAAAAALSKRATMVEVVATCAEYWPLSSARGPSASDRKATTTSATSIRRGSPGCRAAEHSTAPKCGSSLCTGLMEPDKALRWEGRSRLSCFGHSSLSWASCGKRYLIMRSNMLFWAGTGPSASFRSCGSGGFRNRALRPWVRWKTPSSTQSTEIGLRASGYGGGNVPSGSGSSPCSKALDATSCSF